jgi:hypothetical protein
MSHILLTTINNCKNECPNVHHINSFIVDLCTYSHFNTLDLELFYTLSQTLAYEQSQSVCVRSIQRILLQNINEMHFIFLLTWIVHCCMMSFVINDFVLCDLSYHNSPCQVFTSSPFHFISDFQMLKLQSQWSLSSSLTFLPFYLGLLSLTGEIPVYV